MFWHQKGTYCAVKESEDSDSDHSSLPTYPLKPRNHNILRILPNIAHLLFFSVSLTLLIIAYQTKHHTRISQPLEHSFYSPALDELGHFSRTLKFNGTLDYPSSFRGPPNQRVDEAWERITKMGAFAVSKDAIARLGKSTVEAVRYPAELAEGYMASMEVFHQLHCVDLLRRRIYIDYYSAKNPEFWASPTTPTHVDHCIEMLRQVLMCNADLGIVTYNFVAFRDQAWPDFNTFHKCRDFEKVLEWGNSHALHDNTGRFHFITKTKGAYALPTAP